MNTITVSFFPCSPTPANGYNIQWRLAGSADAYTSAGNFASSPAIFTDSTNPDGSDYEGIIRSDCGGGVFGNAVAWSTVTESEAPNFVLSAAYNFAITAYSGTGTPTPAITPTAVNGSVSGHHTAMSGNFTVTLSGTLIFNTKLDLYRNNILIGCIQVTGSGVYNFGAVSAAESDVIEVFINNGVC